MQDQQQTRTSFFIDAGWLLVFGLASSWWCLSASQQLGPVFDESIYMQEGLTHWRTGSYQPLLRLGTMPLQVDVQTLPLYLWEKWQGHEIDVRRDLDTVLPYARAATLLFWWLLLLYGMLAGRQLAGPWGGRVAVAFLACEPSLLAHASLATTDICVTACLLALVYHFRIGREANFFWRCLFPAFWFGLAFLAKASGPIYALVCLGIIELERLARQGRLWLSTPASWWARWQHSWNQCQSCRRDLHSFPTRRSSDLN